MARSFAIQSIDLAMTRYTGVPSPVPLVAANSWGSLDLQVVPGRARKGQTEAGDLGTVSERANLGQALTLRLLTQLGALEPLGHPDYGCRLVTLIGRTSDETTRHLARLYVIEAVRQEPRVKALTALSVECAPGHSEVLDISLTVEPLADGDPLTLSLELAL